MKVIINDIEYSINKARKFAAVISGEKIQNSMVLIPEIVNGYPVKEIDAFAFRDNKKLSIIELPNSISKIKFFAFDNCPNLREVLFYDSQSPAKDLLVDDGAFYQCSNLIQFLSDSNIPVTCGIEAFKNCRNLEYIRGCLYVLRNKSFENCFKLDNLTFAPNTWWKTETFKGCSDLKHLTFLGDVEEMLPNTCMKWISKRNIKCQANTSLSELVYLGTNIEFINK